MTTALLPCWPPAGLDHDPLLVCLAPAGSGCGQFRAWVPADCGFAVAGVQLPGREERWADPPMEFEAVVMAVAGRLAQRPPSLPLVLFGASLGGLLAYEIGRTLGTTFTRWPDVVVLASCRPPRAWVGAGRGLVAENAEIERLVRARELDVELDGDARSLLADLIRSDARFSLGYRHRGDPLQCPVQVWGGAADPIVPVADLAGWSDYADAGFEQVEFPGGHYFWHEQALVQPRLHRLLRTRSGT